MIRVLMEMPKQEVLVESASLTMTAETTKITSQDVQIPEGIVLDETFAATPLVRNFSTTSGLDHHSLTSMAFASQSSNTFLLRGTIDSNDMEAVFEQASRSGINMYSDPEIGAFPTCGATSPVGTGADVRRLSGSGTLAQLGAFGQRVAVAIVDTGINLRHLQNLGLSPTLDSQHSWSPVPTQAGAHPLGHGTMCAYDVLLLAPNAVLLDFAVLRSTRRGGSVMDGLLSDAIQAYGILLNQALLPAAERPYQSLVVSNSWGVFHPSWDFPPGNVMRYIDNPQHPFNIQVGALARAGADIVFAAGNCGPACPDNRCQGLTQNTITGANSHGDVLCVGGVDTRDALVGYSSHGPGALTPQKPDLATYTHFLGSQAFGTNSPDSGTSAACPVASGAVAALRSIKPFDSGISKRSTSALRQFLRDQCRQTTGSGWNAQNGHGILDLRPLTTSVLDAALG